ncbi:MAG: PhoU domain-containing protein [Thermoplasmata archaeon]
MDGTSSTRTRGTGLWTPSSLAEDDDRTSLARRLQRMGTVTIGVSLPREWVGTRNLVVGSTVFLRALADGSLLIQDRDPTTAHASVEVFVQPDRSREHIFRDLVAAYLAGAREFVVHEKGGISPETVAVAKTFARRTLQPEIVSEDREVLILRDVSRGADLDIGALLRRMFQIVLALQQEAARTWSEPDRWRGVRWEHRDDEVDRHAWLIERILALRLAGAIPGTESEIPIDRPLQTLVLVRSLERIGDHAVQIAEQGLRWAETSPTERLVRPLSEFHGQVLDQLRAAFRVASEERDAGHANDVIDVGEALHATYTTLTESLFARGPASGLSALAAVPLGLILQSIDRTVSYAQDIAEVGLDRSTVVSLTEAPPARPVTAGLSVGRIPRPRTPRASSRGTVRMGPPLDSPPNRRSKQEKEQE